MKLSAFLFAAALALTLPARADDAPPASGQSTPAPSPVPAGQQHQNPAPVAKKEEEPETPPASSKGFSLAALKQYLPTTRKTAAAAVATAEEQNIQRIASLEQQLTALQAENRALKDGTALQAALAENTKLRGDLEAFAVAAQERGLLEETADASAPAATSTAGQAVSSIINGQVAKELRAIGHTPKNPANTGAPARQTTPTDGKPLSASEQAAVTRDYWAARGASWTQAASN